MLLRGPAARHDTIPLARARTEDPVVADQVDSRGRHQGRELLDQLLRLEDDVGRAVALAMLEAVQEPSILAP